MISKFLSWAYCAIPYNIWPRGAWEKLTAYIYMQEENASQVGHVCKFPILLAKTNHHLLCKLFAGKKLQNDDFLRPMQRPARSYPKRCLLHNLFKFNFHLSLQDCVEGKPQTNKKHLDIVFATLFRRKLTKDGSGPGWKAILLFKCHIILR